MEWEWTAEKSLLYTIEFSQPNKHTSMRSLSGVDDTYHFIFLVEEGPSYEKDGTEKQI